MEQLKTHICWYNKNNEIEIDYIRTSRNLANLVRPPILFLLHLIPTYLLSSNEKSPGNILLHSMKQLDRTTLNEKEVFGKINKSVPKSSFSAF